MRLFLALAAAQSVGLFLTPSDAFCPASLLTNNKRSVTLNVGSWDNDEFLESLSSNNKNNAGDNDDLPEKETPGDELTEEQRKKISEMNDQEEYQGGTRLKQIMEAAKKAQTEGGNSMTPVQNPFAENPFEGIEGLDPQATPSPAPGNLNLNEMTVEQQAEMFRQMMQGNMQPPPVQAAPDVAIPPLPRPPAPDRKVGRNRDADAIQNTADVYFAQLKRDSTVRGIARIRGDYDQSNEVFADPKIKELENMIQENPHLK